MPGAIALAAKAAARAGAGYVRVSTSRPIDGLPVGDRPDRHCAGQRRADRLPAGRPGPRRHPAGADAGADVEGAQGDRCRRDHPSRRAGTAEGPGRDHHAARRASSASCSARLPGTQARARAGGGAAVGRGGRLQGPRYAGRGAGRAARLRAAAHRVAGERGDRRRPCRDDRRDARAGLAGVRSGLRRRLAARPRGGDRRAADDRRRSRRRDPRSARARCERADRPHCRARRRRDAERPPRAVRRARRCRARRRRAGARARITRSRRAAISRNAAGASSSMPTTRPIAAISFRGSRRRWRSMGSSTEIREPHLSPPNSRRRATLQGAEGRAGRRRRLQCRDSRTASSTCANATSCGPSCSRWSRRCAQLLAAMLQPKRIAEIQLTLIDQGVDVLLKGVPARRAGRDRAADRIRDRPRPRAAQRRSRAWRRKRCTSRSRQPSPCPAVPVRFPPGAFLQATEDGEDGTDRSACRRRWRSAARLPTCSPASARSRWRRGAAYAAEASRDAAAALKRAAPAIDVEHRDLYRRPLDREELQRVRRGDPRSAARRGRRAGRRSSPRSTVPRIAYVSCNPATFARDAKMLVDGGYALEWVQPVGQFRWSTHVELAACFSR